MKHIRKHGQEGIALLTAVIFIAVATLGLVALTLRAVTQNRQVVQYVDFRNCFQGLEAGYAMSKADLETGGTGMIGLGTWAPSGTPPALPSFDDAGIAPLQIPTMPGVEYMAYVTDWSNDGVDNNGNGAIDELD